MDEAGGRRANLEKAIEIKRRAQRCIQSGDLAGALAEYQKLTQGQDPDPYNHVLIADLHFKRGDNGEACQSYLTAVTAYEKSALYKNAIAICKKMIRLSLSPPVVLQRLAQLHALDGLQTEAALYYMQYAEHQVREEKYRDAVGTLRTAVETCPENVPTLERLAEAQLLADDVDGAVATFTDAWRRWTVGGLHAEAKRVRERAEHVRPGCTEGFESMPLEVAPPAPEPPVTSTSPSPPSMGDPFAGDPPPPEPASNALLEDATDNTDDALHGLEARSAFAPTAATTDRPHGFESTNGRHDAAPAADGEGPPEVSLEDIEGMLREAEQQLRGGARDEAAATLLRAAQSYEAIGRHDNAGAIYRSLARSPHVPDAVLPLWLGNCERRNDKVEAAQVACQIGERALSAGDHTTARTWFERAVAFDPANDLATRRLQRLDQMAAPAATPVTKPVPAETSGPGRVAVAVGRAQAVTFDLNAMLDEFQRAVGEQLSGDAQSHYDLGMTYREMGLAEQAIDAFRVAAADPDYRPRCAEMIGRTLLDQGRFEEAIEEFAAALETKPPADAALSLQYHLGLAYEASGNTQQALSSFEQIAAAQGDYPDVGAKIHALRRTLENV